RLPSSVLNGRFTIRDESNSGYLSFSVEEYKRPKFYVEIEKSSDAYKLGDIVSVAGKAVAYAGNNINNANVSYRVVRKPVWNIYRHSYIWPPYNNEVTEITSGTVETDGSGNFKFTFETAQEPSSKNDFTYYTYEISVDVTDLSGETRSSEKNLVIGNRRIYLSMNLPSPLPATDLKEIYLSATNSSGVAQRIPATINFFELQAPQKMLRERLWRQPDQFILDQKTYNNLFPLDVYADEDQMNKWKRVGLSATISDTISADEPVSLRGKTLKPGWYYVEVISADQDGAEVKTEGYIQLTGTGLFSPFAGINVEGKTKAEPGEQINWTIKSNPGDVTAIYELNRQNEQGSPQIISINKTKSFTLNVGENDRGGIDVNVAFIRHNRFYEYTHRIDVPFSNKELDITYTSYRDKTLPGSEEKWSLTIKGSKGEKLLSEVLTGMYDASLDQYIAHQWYKPGLWYGKRSGGWNSYGNFTTVTSLPKYPERNFPVYFRKTYDYLFHNLIYKDYELVFESPVFAQNKLREDGVMALNKLADDASYEVKLMATAADIETKQAGGESELPAPPAPSFRKNFNETAFFFPQLRTDSAGNISFSFTIPEALTTWKWMTLAHTKDLRFGLSTKEIITQKQLMVQPGIPRFLREGDKLNLSVKVANLTDQEMTGKIELQLLDAVTMAPVDG
ncbi:MAG TPA: alpha-2-macroglobulin family protein, partial [Parasegetibacter sp.]